MTVTEHDAAIDPDQDVAGIDPVLMETCLRVLAQVEELPSDAQRDVASKYYRRNELTRTQGRTCRILPGRIWN